jgi:ParB family transcriptional regulator, chromosome partitioning protein
MNLRDKFAAKTKGLVPPNASEPTTVVKGGSPKTGPGQMLAFRSHMSENNQKVMELEAKIELLSGSVPVVSLDARRVKPSAWANRHLSNFESPEFLALKSEIATTDGNVQPIKVRESKLVRGDYEIVFGHRRHRACLELGCTVKAIVEEVDDKQLFLEMDSENRSRKDLSPWEQGTMYRKALDSGLFPSLRQLASAVGVDPGNASKALAVANLPDVVVNAFPSPTCIQFRWSALLSTALLKDPDGTLSRAEAMAKLTPRPSPRDVLNLLLGRHGDEPVSSNSNQKLFPFKVFRDSSNAVTISFDAGCLTAKQEQRLLKFLERVISK